MDNAHEIQSLKDSLENLKEAEEALNKAFPEKSKQIGDVITSVTARLAELTTPQIKKNVLVHAGSYGIELYKPEIHGVKPVIPLTIEELLPTLAQWVPGAVRWEYSSRGRIILIDANGEEHGLIPAPPRDDWQEVGGEL